MAKARLAALGLTGLLAFVGGYEGLRLVAYKDPVGIPTICYGHTHGVSLTDRATLDQCEERLGRELLAAVRTVTTCVDEPLTPGEIGAFADLVYNAGPRPVCDQSTSTMARKLAAGDVVGACHELPRWNKATVAGKRIALPGLTRRRADAMAMCLSYLPIDGLPLASGLK